jgi:KDO2-lipid IV(A) lauroyltransferase
VAFFVGLLSWRGTQKLGAALGLVWFHVVRLRRKVVFENLKVAFGDSHSQNKRIAASAYRHFGTSAMEFFKLRSMESSEVQGHVHVHGIDNYDIAKADNRGVIVVTAHLGNFDLLACSQSASGIPLGIVSRELHRGGVSRFWMETRGAKNLKIFPEKGAAKQILRWLKGGNALGLTVDQRTRPERGGIRVPFLGKEAWTTTAPAELAYRTGAALLPVRIIRRPDGDHDVFVEPMLSVSNLEKEEQIRTWTLQINSIVGKWVREQPEQWLWLHKRFVDSI